MPWFAWIAIVAIVVFGLTQVISMATGRPIPSGENEDEIEKLKQRLAELESAPEPEPHAVEDRIPSKSEENLAAEDRWRLEMLEARLEELEKERRDESGEPEAT